MLTSEKIVRKLEENREKIEHFGVKKIGLFGSYIKNKQKTGSDIDILVEFNKGKKTFNNYMDLKFFLENLFDSGIDLVVIEALKPELKPYILGSVRYASGI